MSAAMMVSYRMPELPWAGSPEDDLRFKRVLRNVLIICALLILLGLVLPVNKPDRSKVQELPPQLATMILENVKPPPPPPKPKQEDLVKPDAVNAETAHKELNKEVPVPEARVPLPNKPPGEIAAARRKAAGVGLLAMSNDLAELRGAPMAVQLAPVKPGAGVGTGTGVGVGAGTDPGVPARALITSNATGGSGGINTSGYSNNTGGGGLAGRSTTLVEGVAGGGGARGRGDAAGNNPGGNVQRGNSGKASRSIEEIKLVFERNKGAIYSIYNRALRDEPGLQGKVVVELKIAPSGSVVDCKIISSELKSPTLEAKLKARILQFDFGAKNVEQMVVTWPLDFLPS
ncbi:MAG: AgmX/PglI C-terminal domain-containing protein [Burkholderiaceae bacterium]